MERPIRQPAEPSVWQEVYEMLAAQDTSNSHWREWRDLSPAERTSFEAAMEARLRRHEAEQAEEADTAL